MTLSQWITYCLATFSGGIIPGPIMLLAMTVGAKRGVLSALPAAMGNVLASALQVLLSIAFVSTIAQFIDAYFSLMIAAGGIYLIYLGVGLYKSNPFNFPIEQNEFGRKTKGWVKDFTEVFLITMINPKAIIFFLALFPQVIPRDNYSPYLVINMTVVFSIIALLCFAIYAVFGHGIRQLAGNSMVSTGVNFVLSAIFVMMGAMAVIDAVVTN